MTCRSASPPRPLSRKFIVRTHFADGSSGTSGPYVDKYICGGEIRLEAFNLATAKARSSCEEGITVTLSSGSTRFVPPHQVKFCTIEEVMH